MYRQFFTVVAYVVALSTLPATARGQTPADRSGTDQAETIRPPPNPTEEETEHLPPSNGDSDDAETEDREPAAEESAPSEATEPVIDDKTDMVLEDAGEAATVEEVRRLGFMPSPAVGTNREPARPAYVRSIAEHGQDFGVAGLGHLDWLDVAVQQRTRYEHRSDYYRAGLETGDQLLLRSRFYLGVRDVLDPFRFAVEFQDARRCGDAIDDISNVNETEILQLYGGVYSRDAVGDGYPLRLRAGRMSFDSIDRRLVARNRFRNTTNAYDGLRLTLGRQITSWEMDFFAVRPVERFADTRDQSNSDEWLYGATAYWRGWSPGTTLEPYYFFLNDDTERDREIHTVGLHGFGLIGESGWDYDFNFAFQFGSDGDLSHRAFAMHGEIGYTFDEITHARIAAWLNYATGDRDPNDGVNQRFDRLYGASHSMYGYSDLFTWQNMINPTLYFTVRPDPRLRFEVFYRAYWLDSRTDAWVVPGLRDPSGNSGRFIGQELDLRIAWQLARHVGLEIGYAHFMPGNFVTNTEPGADDSDFFYIQATLRL